MSKRTRTTSDHATDRMLWAPLRLSVRGAGTQLRYGRLAGPARRVRGAPGFSGLGCWGARIAVPAQVVPVRPHTFGWCWDGIACEAGVRKRSPACFKIALPLYPALIPRNMRHADTPRHSRIARPGREGRTARGRPRAVRLTRLPCGSEVHVTAAAGRGGGRVLLRLLRDHGLGGEEQARDRSRVLQRRPGDLRGVDDAGLEHVDIITGRGVQALPAGQGLDLLDHHAALEAGVHRDLLERLFQRTAHDLRAGGLVARQVQLLEGAPARLQQRDAAAGHDTLLDRGLGVAHRVLDAVLALLQLDLGSRPRLDDGDAAGQLGQPLLQLLPVVVRVGVVDLGPDLVDPARDLVRVARAVDDRGLVLGDHDLAGPAEHVEVDVVQLEADFLADDLATGEDGDVTEHGLAAVAEAGGLDRHRLEQAAHLVHDQGRQGLAVDVLGDDDQRLAGLHHLVEQGEQVLVRRDLGVHHEDVRILEDGLEPLRVGDEVRRDVSLV